VVPRHGDTPPRAERGAALVEFALVSIVLYLLLAGTIEFGRLMFDANALQDVARLTARELALAPVSAGATFEYALTCDPARDANCLVDLRSRVFDPACLVVDLNDPAVSQDADGYFAAMPVVNRALRTLMITEPQRPNILRYAGALMTDESGAACSAIGPNGQASPTGLTVGIPLIEGRDPTGAETIRLRGIDTPELGRPGARAAAIRLAELLRAGPVTIVPRAEDVYGRTVADVYVAGRNVADVLRREGFGKPRGR